MAGSGGRARRPTQADVARRAAVSQPVVSYVLNGDPAAPVAPATRARVEAAIAELGYVPHHAARSLRRRRTSAIAAVIPDITNPFYPAFERGIQDAAERYGIDVIAYNTDGAADKERLAIASARDGRADGVVVVPMGLPLAELGLLVERGAPVVALTPAPVDDSTLPIDALYVDNAAAARTAVAFLAGRGHRRIGMIAGQVGTPTREQRVLGYLAALRAHGLPADRRLVRGQTFGEEGGYEAMRELLCLPRPPTAVFAANDLLAMGAMLALREAGLAIPSDLAIVGLDDIPAARLVSPGLTTVAQYPERLGRRAAEMVWERLAGEVTGPGRRQEMPFALVERGSA